MQPSVNKALVKAANTQNRNDTAFFIFDRQSQLSFRVSAIHHKMNNGAMGDPMIGLTKTDMDAFSSQMISIYAPVIVAVDYYIDGASLDISTETAVEMYDRIDKHLDAHISAMRTDVGYYIGNTFSVFENLVEFATALYPRVHGYKQANKIKSQHDSFTSMISGRANFMTLLSKSDESEKKKADNGEKMLICPMQDKLERMQVYYESSQSWRIQ